MGRPLSPWEADLSERVPVGSDEWLERAQDIFEAAPSRASCARCGASDAPHEVYGRAVYAAEVRLCAPCAEWVGAGEEAARV